MRKKNPRPVVEAWKDFDTFIAQVAPRPGRRFRIYGIDRSQPIGPDNYIWKESAVEKLPGESQKDYARRQQKAHREMYPGQYKDAALRRNFGPDFGLEAYEALYVAQHGKCAVCGSVEKAKDIKGNVKMLAAEHDHRTGVIRSLSCQACNAVVGYAEDDIRILQAAIDYLIKHKAEPGETRFVPFEERKNAA
jgi:hypothetical protein